MGDGANRAQQIQTGLGVIMKQEQLNIPARPSALFMWQAAAATVLGFVNGTSPEAVARSKYPNDPVTPLILRGATTPAITTDPAWAGPLARQSVSLAIEEIVAMSAMGALLRAGAFNVDLGQYGSVRVPGRATTAANAGKWVQEGHPIPAVQLNILGGPVLTPTKLAVLLSMTREITEASNIEDIVRMLVTEAASLALDAAVFSTSAATPAQPAGLLNGLTPLTATAGASLGFDACGQDLGKLVGDIAARAGGVHAFFVCAPSQATSIRFWAGGQFGRGPQGDILPVAPAASLATTGTVVCLEPESLAITLSDPQFSVSNVAAVHQEDTTPLDISSGGVLASPVKSMFQTDALALRMTLSASWGMRAPHVSYMTGVGW
jgi:hypothetical protein